MYAQCCPKYAYPASLVIVDYSKKNEATPTPTPTPTHAKQRSLACFFNETTRNCGHRECAKRIPRLGQERPKTSPRQLSFVPPPRQFDSAKSAWAGLVCLSGNCDKLAVIIQEPWPWRRLGIRERKGSMRTSRGEHVFRHLISKPRRWPRPRWREEEFHRLGQQP